MEVADELAYEPVAAGSAASRRYTADSFIALSAELDFPAWTSQPSPRHKPRPEGSTSSSRNSSTPQEHKPL
jgi:hypothetical protein